MVHIYDFFPSNSVKSPNSLSPHDIKIRDTSLEKYKEGISVSFYSDQLRQTLFKMLMNLKYILNQNQQNI